MRARSAFGHAPVTNVIIRSCVMAPSARDTILFDQ
jgi:hypothetical protein